MISFPYGTEFIIDSDELGKVTVYGICGEHKFHIMSFRDIGDALEFFEECVIYCKEHRTEIPKAFMD